MVTPNQKLLFEQLIAKLEPGIRDAFAAMVLDLHLGIDWKALLAALKVGDVEAAVAAMHVDAAAFQTLASSMSSAYGAGGALAAATINGGPGGARVLFRFNMSNPVAEAWIRQYVGQRITGQYVPETLEAIRQTIAEGYTKGQNPLTIATDLAGRVESGVRKGGLLGLDKPRADRLRIVTQGMRTPEGVRDLVVMKDGVLQVRYKVNAATAKRILSAYSKGTAVPEAQRIVSEKQYTSLLLKARADTIARTETGQAVMSARYEAWRQAAANEGYDTSAIIKTWRHGSHSKQARPEHIAMNGVSVRGLYSTFDFPKGIRKQHALDGIGFGYHDINCGCGTDFRLDRSKGLK